jgi:rod shape-determining protein MreD
MPTRWLRYAVFVLIAALLQASQLLELIAVTGFNIKPDLLLVLMVFFAITAGPSEAIVLSFATGFAADIINLPIGPYMIAFGLLGALLAYVRNFIIIGRMVGQSVAIFVTSLLANVLSGLLAHLRGQPAPPHMYSVFLGSALYSAVLGPYLCSIFRLVAHWLGLARKYRLRGAANR